MSLKQKVNSPRGNALTSTNSLQPTDIITQVNPNDQDKKTLRNNDRYWIINMLCRCFTPKFKYKNPLPEPSVKPNSYLIGPQFGKNLGRKTLILDLDETLVHSTFEKIDNPDIVIPIKIQGMEYKINVIKRPGVDEFLAKMGEIYEVVIYTASLSEYAIPLVNNLDTTKIVAYKLFREHCTPFNGVYVKDLSRLGRDLKDTIIIDNSVNSFMFQPNNAYHIKNFFFDKNDRELDRIIPFFEFLADTHDIRPVEDWHKKFFDEHPFQYYDITNKKKIFRKQKSNTIRRINRYDSTSSAGALNQLENDTKSTSDQTSMTNTQNSKSLLPEVQVSKSNSPSIKNQQKIDDFGYSNEQEGNIKKSYANSLFNKDDNDIYNDEAILPSPKEYDSLLAKKSQAAFLSKLTLNEGKRDEKIPLSDTKNIHDYDSLNGVHKNRKQNLKRLEIQINEEDEDQSEIGITDNINEIQIKALNKVDNPSGNITNNNRKIINADDNNENENDIDSSSLVNLGNEDDIESNNVEIDNNILVEDKKLRNNIDVNSPAVRIIRKKSFILPDAVVDN